MSDSSFPTGGEIYFTTNKNKYTNTSNYNISLLIQLLQTSATIFHPQFTNIFTIFKSRHTIDARNFLNNFPQFYHNCNIRRENRFENPIWYKQSVYSEMHSKPNIAVSINNNTRLSVVCAFERGWFSNNAYDDIYTTD